MGRFTRSNLDDDFGHPAGIRHSPDPFRALTDQDGVVVLPTDSPGSRYTTQRHRRTSGQRYFLELVAGPESDLLAIGRKERTAPSIFGARDAPGLQLVQRT